jgi:hypothetical protein
VAELPIAGMCHPQLPEFLVGNRVSPIGFRADSRPRRACAHIEEIEFRVERIDGKLNIVKKVTD